MHILQLKSACSRFPANAICAIQALGATARWHTNDNHHNSFPHGLKASLCNQVLLSGGF